MRRMAKCLAVLLALSLLLTTAAFAADGTEDKLIISAGEVNAKAGETVTVPITITQNPGFVALQLQITYDADALTLQTENGVVDKALVSGLSFLPNAENAGVVKALFEKGAATSNITATGTLMELNFTVAENAAAKEYPIQVTVQAARNYALQTVPNSGQNGKVTVGTETAKLENLTGATPTAVVTAPAAGWKDGANTFTVSNMVGGKDVACVVLVKSGDIYTRLTATKGSDNTYSFTTPEGFKVASDSIVVAVKGDVNGDGSVTKADSTQIKAAFNSKKDLSALQRFSSDVNGDNTLTKADSTKVKAVFNGKTTLDW